MAESQSYLLTIQSVDSLRWNSTAYSKLRAKVLPNLYVEVYIGGTLVTRTTVLKKSIEPIWAEKLTIPSAQASSKLTLKLKHKSAVYTDSCFGTVDETVGHLLQLCKGEQVARLKLQHGPKTRWSDAQGFLAARIEMVTGTQARENEALAAKKALERLQPKSSDAGRGAKSSVHEMPEEPTAASSSAAGEGFFQAAHQQIEAENATSVAPEHLEALRATENNDSRESRLAAPAIELPEVTKNHRAEETPAHVSKPEEDPHTGHTASTSAISQGLETLVNTASQNSDVLVSLGNVLDKIQRIADVTVSAVDTLAKVHPYANAAWQVLSSGYKAYKQQKETDAAVIGLFTQMEELYSFVDDIDHLPSKIERLGDLIVHVLQQTTECGIFFREYTDRGFAVRLAGQAIVNRSQTISDLSSKLNQLRKDLKSGVFLHTAFVSSQTRDGVNKLVEFENLKKLRPAVMDATDRPVCLAGTKQDLIKDILDQLMNPSDQSKNILWLHGPAGLGKSTVATTVAEYFRELQRRGAFLFFDRNSKEESDPKRVISTLAYQVAEHNVDIRAAVSAAIEADRQVVSAPFASQFSSLLFEPLSKASALIEGPIVVVLDALDECGDASSRRILLDILTSLKFAKLPRQIRFLITSRPEPDIEDALDSCDHVHGVDLSMASPADLRLYIKSELQHIYSKRHIKAGLKTGWPGEMIIDRLVAFAAGLFIWAATAMKYLYIGNPAQRLENLAQDRTAFTLHDLYRTALLSVWDSEMAVACKQVLGLVIVSQAPLTDETITNMLGFADSGTTCRLVLQRLGCVIHGSEGQTVRMLHKSFPDYLTNHGACGSEAWFIDVQEHQLALAHACLRIMNTQLHFNMCDLESSHVPNAHIENLSECVEAAIPFSLSYSCQFWGHHLHHVLSGEPSVLPAIVQLFGSKFLYWLEVLSLLGEVQVAPQILLAVKKFVPDDDAELQAFAQDALKFVRVFAPAIAYSTPHIYVSCVPLAPPLSIIKRQYIPSLEHTLVISGDAQYGWPALQQVYKGHTHWVTSAAFSPDGRRIASGSFNGSIHIWDAETGLLAVGPIQGGADRILSVAFSPDGHTVASGSMDGTVHIWDAETGVLAVGPFEAHTDTVYSVAFSPDGLRLASGSGDGTVRIWNTETGVLAAGPFEGHTDKVNSVVFAPDGQKVAFGSDDKTVCIWDIKTSRRVVTKGHSGQVWSVAFSPDGLHVASGSEDQTVCIWDAETGTLTAGPLEGHTEPVTSVAYSPDGLRVVSGSDDQTIRIWSLQSGTVTQTYKGHTDRINSVAFSSEGQRIVSASYDCTVRIWDAEAGPLAVRTSELSKRHTKDIYSVVFSPDGRHIASDLDDCTMCIWGAETGKLTGGPYEGHTYFIWSVAFSPDGRRVATGSGDHTIRLWDVEMGSHVTFTGHTDAVLSVAFSPDGRMVVSGSEDKTICMWDSETGVLTAGPVEGHEGSVRSVVFSPDGRQVASGSDDWTVRIWAVDTSVLKARKFEGHSGGVNSVAFSPDGRKIASGSDDKTVRICDIETGSHVAIGGHTERVRSVAFSPDGRHIASCSDDKSVRIWDVETGALIAGPFKEHSTFVFSVVFAPDGRRLASSGRSTIRVFDVAALHKQEEALRLCSRERMDHGDKASEGFSRLSQLQEDGWMVNPDGDLLFYVPPDLREGLCWPHETAVINVKQMTHLDVSQFAHGADWAQCHIAE
ncbi:hypothetical protein HWV62_32965 [Athelia sp. TMB]|nr:hypothetical protein HWV62_32965 [Athelia sp. TMB]